jgi:hypothetical protein
MYRHTKLAFASLFLSLATTFAQGQVQLRQGKYKRPLSRHPSFKALWWTPRGRPLAGFSLPPAAHTLSCDK